MSLQVLLRCESLVFLSVAGPPSFASSLADGTHYPNMLALTKSGEREVVDLVLTTPP
jgi:hypothetical protein